MLRVLLLSDMLHLICSLQSLIHDVTTAKLVQFVEGVCMDGMIEVNESIEMRGC